MKTRAREAFRGEIIVSVEKHADVCGEKIHPL
jgi:hypothetical protein